MATVWVIDERWHADHMVKGIYSSKEHAELAASHGVTGEICEWALDPCIEQWQKGWHTFRVIMNYAGDARVDIYPSVSPQTYGPVRGKDPDLSGRSYLCVIRFAKESTDVVQIADTLRVQYIATGRWGAE